MRVTALDHIVLTVRDLDRTLAFYAGLGMRHEVFCPDDGTERHALSFGRQKINLHVAGSEFEPRAATALPGTGDLCFLSDQPVADWIAHFEREGIEVIEGPVARTGAVGRLVSIYVRDPDGNLVEIANG